MKKSFRTLRGKLSIIALSYSFGTSVFLTIASFLFMRSYITENLINSSTSTLKLIAETIELDIKSIRQFEHWCSVSGEFSDIGNQQSQQANLQLYEKLIGEVRTLRAAPFIKRIIISNQESNRFIQHTSASSSPVTRYNIEKLKALSDESFSCFCYDPFLPKNENCIIPLTIKIYDKNGKQNGSWGYIAIDSAIILSRFADFQTDDVVFITLGNTTYKLKNGMLSKGMTSELLQLKQIVTCPIPEGKITLSISLSHLIFKRLRDFFIHLLLLFGIGLCLLGFGIKETLAKIVTVPVSKLQKQLDRVAAGSFAPNPGIEWDDEFGDIGRGLNNLSKSVSSLMISRVEDEKKRQQLEYKVLQNQINPHFLYNTLNSIKWMATIQNAVGIAEMVTSLARLLKNISKTSNSLVSLSEELSLLEDYFVILQYRYGGAITMIKDIDTDITDALIPRFTLQPLLENAIFHGIEPTGNAGSITLSIHKLSTGIIEIHLTDNGRGMDAEQIKEILYQDENDGQKNKSGSGLFKSMGILNVQKRIKYEYGSQYGVSIVSEKNKYTTVKIDIPYKKGGENTDV